LLLIGLTIAYLTIYSQDSLRNVPVKAWQLSRLIDEVRAGRVCDTLVVKLDSTIVALKNSLNAQGTLLEFRTEQRDTLLHLTKVWERRVTNLGTIHKAEKKAERKKGFKIGFISGSGLGLVLLILLL